MAMHDISFVPGRVIGGKSALGLYHLKRMILSPKQWRACRLPIELKWEYVRFNEKNAQHLPSDYGGVYTFVVQPGIANHPACSYLLYVGKTEKQNFRTRYRDYLRDKKLRDKSRRPHVEEMLSKWNGHLWFYYARIDQEELIDSIERILLTAYLPPVNKIFPGEAQQSLKRFFGQ